MADSHSARADELAGQGNRKLDEALRASKSAIEDCVLLEPQVAAELAEHWAQLAAIQRQAEIHARLATNDTLFSRSGL